MSTQGGHGHRCGGSSRVVARAALHLPQCARAGTPDGTHMLVAAERRAGGGVCMCDATIAAAAHARAKRSWRGLHIQAPPPVPLVSASQKLGERGEGEERHSDARAPTPPPLGTTEKRKKGGQTRRQGARLTGLAAGLPLQGCSGKGPPPPQSSHSARVSNVAAGLLAALPTLRSNVSLRERRKEKSH